MLVNCLVSLRRPITVLFVPVMSPQASPGVFWLLPGGEGLRNYMKSHIYVHGTIKSSVLINTFHVFSFRKKESMCNPSGDMF